MKLIAVVAVTGWIVGVGIALALARMGRDKR